MCGISGIINTKGIEIHRIKSMSDIIRHRGPDDEGYLFIDKMGQLNCCGGSDTPGSVWSSDYPYSPSKRVEEISNQNIKIAFGHRRLSILDLSPAGHQPMSYLNKRYWIIFNGEIYNYQDIRNELKKLGHQFISRTDSEVVVAAFAQWGENCLQRFVGMWAFVIYDNVSDELFIARDRYGIKPFYYWFSPEGYFCFASEIKQFTVFKEWEAKINPQRAYEYLTYSFTDHTDETMFSGVYQIPSGSCFKMKIEKIKPDASGRINHYRWYTLKREPFQFSFDDAAEIFKDLFERAVKEHLHADVTVGTALSGGLDSSSIVCEVNRILSNNGKTELQKTFSSCSIDEKYDERKWMDIVIDQTRVNAHFVYPDLKEAIELTPLIIWHQDEPYQSQSAFLAYNVFKLASKNGVKVLLNGQGADEYLGGYGQFTLARYAEMLKRLKLLTLIHDIKNLRKFRSFTNLTFLKGMAFFLLPKPILNNVINIRSSSDRIKKVIDLSRFDLKYKHPFESIEMNYRTVPDISEHFTFYSTLPKYLRWEDRNSMAHSVEARVPFLDHRLVEFSYNLPDSFLEKDGINKRIMREALNNTLPEKIKNRKDKMGFTTPEELWVKKENPALFKQKLSDSISLTNGIIKPEALRYFDNVVAGKEPFDYTYWRLILFGEWVRKFKIKTL